MLIRVLVALFVALSLAGCGSDDPVGLEGFDTTTISVDDRAMVVAVAQTPDQRSQGLMGVTDLGGLDGMLFLFEGDTEGGFWMKNTLIPLDIAFFETDGLLVDRLSMAPCVADPCPSYRPDGAYRYALETPEGGLTFVESGALLAFDADGSQL